MKPLTLGQIRAASPCDSGWKALLTGLGYADGRYNSARQITIGDVAFINGINDAIWCLRLVDDPRLRVRAIIPSVDRVAKLTTDVRVHKCIGTLHKWLDGDDDVDFVAAAAEAEAALLASAPPPPASARLAMVVVRVTWAAAREASWAAWAAEAAAWAAVQGASWAGAEAADAARTTERGAQVNDLIALFGRSQ